jgi:hypothetical protein
MCQPVSPFCHSVVAAFPSRLAAAALKNQTHPGGKLLVETWNDTEPGRAYSQGNCNRDDDVIIDFAWRFTDNRCRMVVDSQMGILESWFSVELTVASVHLSARLDCPSRQAFTMEHRGFLREPQMQQPCSNCSGFFVSLGPERWSGFCRGNWR